MEYFRLQQNRQIPYGVLMENSFKIKNYFEAVKGNIEGTGTVISFVSAGKFNWYPDVLDRQIFMYSDKTKKIVSMYEPDIIYYDCCLIEKSTKISHDYNIPQLNLVDCLSDKSEYNLDKSVIYKTTLLRSKIPDCSIFRVSNIQCSLVIISVELAESLLRRDVKGVSLSTVTIEEN